MQRKAGKELKSATETLSSGVQTVTLDMLLLFRWPVRSAQINKVMLTGTALPLTRYSRYVGKFYKLIAKRQAFEMKTSVIFLVNCKKFNYHKAKVWLPPETAKPVFPLGCTSPVWLQNTTRKIVPFYNRHKSESRKRRSHLETRLKWKNIYFCSDYEETNI